MFLEDYKAFMDNILDKIPSVGEGARQNPLFSSCMMFMKKLHPQPSGSLYQNAQSVGDCGAGLENKKSHAESAITHGNT